MNNKKISKQTVSFFVLLAVVVVAAFIHGGWIGGLHTLSFLINLVSCLIMFVVKLLISIPGFTSTVIQNVITTLLIWIICTAFWLTKKEETILTKVVAVVVSTIFTFISWSNLMG